MERSQNLSEVRPPISKFRNIYFMDTVTVRRERSVGVAMTNINTFCKVRSLDVTWWLDLQRPGSEILTCMYGKDAWTGVGAQRLLFSYMTTTLRGVQTPPGPARVNIVITAWYVCENQGRGEIHRPSIASVKRLTTLSKGRRYQTGYNDFWISLAESPWSPVMAPVPWLSAYTWEYSWEHPSSLYKAHNSI